MDFGSAFAHENFQKDQYRCKLVIERMTRDYGMSRSEALQFAFDNSLGISPAWQREIRKNLEA